VGVLVGGFGWVGLGLEGGAYQLHIVIKFEEYQR